MICNDSVIFVKINYQINFFIEKWLNQKKKL